MCIAYLAIRAHADWPLLIAANRDEFHDRPSLAAAPWPDRPDVIAGIDCQAQGTWLGVTRQGRFALLTNYRDPAHMIGNAPSRGELVSRYLTQPVSARQYAQGVSDAGAAYNGFNLIVGDLAGAYYVGNRDPRNQAYPMREGRYVVSNHLLDTPWPKAERLRRALDGFPLNDLEKSLTPVFEMLKDDTRADDHVLPDTGIPLDRERLLSSPFIVSPGYGTRCSTVIAVHASGRAILSEITYDPAGIATERHDWPFMIEMDPPRPDAFNTE
ncbi:NRDE family protein [Paralcaligenes sp. KSB-10]|uniref:NRDE family protein n=1 Tax=Paralcaligenes sp. KSB-10 TaxID=2901142 RepID=UPI001E2C9B8D|nr:NRDE family protein [Paralcaligenes sp. KSB-10]UHL64684.1 NRDE family protein [Paralcaligenes sp. KSB-10]